MSRVDVSIYIIEQGHASNDTLLDCDLEIEYRVYDADGMTVAAAETEAEARRYLQKPGDYLTKTYIIEERI